MCEAQHIENIQLPNPHHFSRICTEKRGPKMADDKNRLRAATIDFAIKISDMCDEIKGCGVYKNQIIRSSSSIGANIHEAKYAQSRADFINKFEIALKESSETDYWLELLYRKNAIDVKTFAQLKHLSGSIRRKLINSITTAKKNDPKNLHAEDCDLP